MKCAFYGCNEPGIQRCSKCKDSYYCSKDHQTKHWKEHKLNCSQYSSSKVPSQTSVPINANVETKTCRCMFCGEEMVLKSEQDAIDHMSVCSSLQEQLNDKNQFTIPKCVMDENKK